jgi:hypothetical protein
MAKKKQEIKAKIEEPPCNKNYYFSFLRCLNCGNCVKYSIPRGQTIKKYVRRNHCAICKCRKLKENFSIFHF